MDFKSEEYELSFYGFSLRQLKIELRLVAAKEVETAIRTFVNKLSEKLSSLNVPTKILQEIEIETKYVVESIFNSFENYFIEFDNLIDKHMQIPDNISLQDDLPGANIATESVEKYLKEDVEEMEKTFKQNLFMVKALESELEIYKSIQHVIEIEDEIADELFQSFQGINNLTLDVKLITDSI